MARKSKSKSARLWYARYPGDYARKTKHLSLAEHGAYALLMDWYYANEKPLPLDGVQLHRICTAVAPHEQEAVQTVLDQFFTRLPGGWHNTRADEEIAHKQEISGIRRAAQAEKERRRLAREGAKAGANGAANRGANEGAFAPTTTTRKGFNPLPPNNPQAVDDGDESEGAFFQIETHLTDRDRKAFHAMAQGRDIQFYFRVYNAGIGDGSIKPPRFPAKHFLAWVEGCLKNEAKKSAY